MDEPLSNLDAKLACRCAPRSPRLQRDLAVTTIYVTHDQVEAMTMGHRGGAARTASSSRSTPRRTCTTHRSTCSSAAFIGSPSMNLYETVLTAGWRALRSTFGDHRLALPADIVAKRPALRLVRRPADRGRHPPRGLRGRAIASDVHPADRRLRATVRLVEALGSELMVHFSIDATE